MRSWAGILVAALLVALPQAARAQQFTATPAAGEMACATIGTRTDRLFCTVLPETVASVTSVAAAALADGATLQATVSGTREAIADTALVAVVDRSANASAFAIEAMRADLSALLGAIPSGSATALVLSSETGVPVAFGEGGAAAGRLAQGLQRISSADALVPALTAALEALAGRPESRKVLVIATDARFGLSSGIEQGLAERIRSAGIEINAFLYQPNAAGPAVEFLEGLSRVEAGRVVDRTGLQRPGAEADLERLGNAVGRYVDIIIGTRDGGGLPNAFRVVVAFSDGTRESFTAEAAPGTQAGPSTGTPPPAERDTAQRPAGERTLEVVRPEAEPNRTEGGQAGGGAATTAPSSGEQTPVEAAPGRGQSQGIRGSIMDVLAEWFLSSPMRMLSLGVLVALVVALIVLALVTSRRRPAAPAGSGAGAAPAPSYGPNAAGPVTPSAGSATSPAGAAATASASMPPAASPDPGTVRPQAPQEPVRAETRGDPVGHTAIVPETPTPAEPVVAAPAVVAAPRQVAAPVDHAEPVAHAEPASEEASGPEEGAAPDPATPTPPALMLPKAAALEIEAVEVETGEDEKAQEPAAGQKSDDELESMVDAEAALAVEGVAEEPVAPELSEEAAPPAQTEAPAGLPAAPSGTDTLIMDAASAGPVMDSAVLEGAAAWLDWIDPALEPSAIRRATTSVGRHESDDIVVSDPTVSRQHILLLELPTGGFEIINRQASRAKPNPIFINGEERATSALNDGDEVRLGRAGARFVFRIASRGAR